jgi:phage terminase small subunit
MALTAKMKRFCEEYMKDLNATQAAIRSGYSKKTAYSIGQENLKKPEIKTYIDLRLKELSISADETTKLLSDIAKSSLNDYFVIKQQRQRKSVKVSLKEYIKRLEKEIELEDEYAATVKYTKEEKKLHDAEQQCRRRHIIKLQIELKHHPKAFRIVQGEEELVEVADLDIVKLLKDKEAGRIKSVTPSEFGLRVEMYSADSALVNLARMHGLFEKDNKQRLQEPLLPKELINSIVDKINKHADAG